MPPDEFGAYVAWPEDLYYFFGGANEAGPSIVVDKDLIQSWMSY